MCCGDQTAMHLMHQCMNTPLNSNILCNCNNQHVRECVIHWDDEETKRHTKNELQCSTTAVSTLDSGWSEIMMSFVLKIFRCDIYRLSRIWDDLNLTCPCSALPQKHTPATQLFDFFVLLVLRIYIDDNLFIVVNQRHRTNNKNKCWFDIIWITIY